MNQPDPTAANSFAAPLPWQLNQWAQLSRAFAANKLAHAYLLSGSPGLGKSQFAHDFTRYALCLNPVRGDKHTENDIHVACGQCNNCRKGGIGHHPDLLRIAPEEGSKNIKIDQIRWLSEFVVRSSHAGGAKIAIIEQAHMLISNAANALLKTLEEPNENTHLFLVSDHPGRLVATIRSRCQKLAFPIPDTEVASSWLQNVIGGGSIETLLDASGGQPLTALLLAEGDSLETRAQLLQSLGEMKRGQKSIQQTLSLTSKMGESEVLQHFSLFLSKLTKYCLTGVQDSQADPALNDLYTLLTPAQDRATAQSVGSALSQLYIEVETARKQLASSTNPNPQLIMESLLWRWESLHLS